MPNLDNIHAKFFPKAVTAQWGKKLIIFATSLPDNLFPSKLLCASLIAIQNRFFKLCAEAKAQGVPGGRAPLSPDRRKFAVCAAADPRGAVSPPRAQRGRKCVHGQYAAVRRAQHVSNQRRTRRRIGLAFVMIVSRSRSGSESQNGSRHSRIVLRTHARDITGRSRTSS